jgi:hypothetical protein
LQEPAATTIVARSGADPGGLARRATMPGPWKGNNMKQNTEVKYASPAIERRENAAGLLSVQKGSYGTPGLDL